MADRLCVVMPVYNEREAIGGVLEKWSTELDRLGIDYVIRPYNDGSKDDSLSVMKQAAAALPHVEVRDKPNGGHGPTILQGYREAAADGFDWIFQIDSDDEMGPESFAQLWSRRNDYDFLVGRRDGRKQALPRRIVSFVSRLVVRLFYGKGHVWDVNAPYRLIRVRALREVLARIPEKTFAPNVILTGMVARLQLRAHELPVPQHDRRTGEVSIKKWKLLKAAVRSFAQTILFSFDKELVRSPVKLVALTLLCLGLFLSLWFFLSPFRIAFAILLLAGCCVLWRCGAGGFVAAAVRWCEDHECLALVIVLVAGCVERIIFLSVFRDLLNFDYINNDFVWLFEKAGDVANGVWPVTKSWTTVAIWGGFIKVFGASSMGANVFAAVIQIVATVFGYVFLRRWCGKLSALLFAFLFFCSINIVQHMPNVTATEHLYSLFILLSLCLCNKLLAARGYLSSMLYAAFLSVSLWLAIWSRGEGLLFWMTVPVWIVIYKGFAGRKIKLAAVSAVVFCMLFCGGALLAIRINEVTSNAKTIFCSEDNLWPRLHGVTLSSEGTCINTNSTLILNQYMADHPDAKWEYFPEDMPRWGKFRRPKRMFYNCPHELVPYVRKEISRRWGEMTFAQFVPFVIKKEIRDWCGDYLYTLEATLKNGKSRVPYYLAQASSFFFPSLIALLGLLAVVRSMLFLLTGRCDFSSSFPAAIVISVIALNFGTLMLAEASLRYGYAFYLLWPIMGASLIGSLHDSVSKKNLGCKNYGT